MRDFIIVNGERIASSAGGEGVLKDNEGKISKEDPVHEPIQEVNDSEYSFQVETHLFELVSETF